MLSVCLGWHHWSIDVAHAEGATCCIDSRQACQKPPLSMLLFYCFAWSQRTVVTRCSNSCVCWLLADKLGMQLLAIVAVVLHPAPAPAPN